MNNHHAQVDCDIHLGKILYMQPQKTPKMETLTSIFLPSLVKSLTDNTELIMILNRLDHGVSYSLLMEA